MSSTGSMKSSTFQKPAATCDVTTMDAKTTKRLHHNTLAIAISIEISGEYHDVALYL